MNTLARARQPHVVLGLPSRDWKAMKIERLLDLAHPPQPVRMLEVGTGSGGIAHYFATHPSLGCLVTALDVRDNRRLVPDGYEYRQVQGVELPFDDASFDIVLTNDVIEHVCDDDGQAQHLSELRRALKPDGIDYFAVPNRWMLVEPHYKLAFLSWWSEGWRAARLKLWRKDDPCDRRRLSRGDFQRGLAVAGFRGKQQYRNALRINFEIELPDSPFLEVFSQVRSGRSLCGRRRDKSDANLQVVTDGIARSAGSTTPAISCPQSGAGALMATGYSTWGMMKFVGGCRDGQRLAPSGDAAMLTERVVSMPDMHAEAVAQTAKSRERILARLDRQDVPAQCAQLLEPTTSRIAT